MYKVFVYGTLKKGHYNHHLLNKGTFLGEHITEPKYTMYKMGFPMAVPGGKTAIYGEVWEVDKETLNRLDMLEGYMEGSSYNMYDRATVKTKWGPAIMYTWARPINSYMVKVETGIF